jgi:hypothetical protein
LSSWVVAKDMALVYRPISEMGESTLDDEVKRTNHKVISVQLHENAKKRILRMLKEEIMMEKKLYCSRTTRKKTYVRNLQARYRDMKDKDGN